MASAYIGRGCLIGIGTTSTTVERDVGMEAQGSHYRAYEAVSVPKR